MFCCVLPYMTVSGVSLYNCEAVLLHQHDPHTVYGVWISLSLKTFEYQKSILFPPVILFKKWNVHTVYSRLVTRKAKRLKPAHGNQKSGLSEDSNNDFIIPECRPRIEFLEMQLCVASCSY